MFRRLQLSGDVAIQYHQDTLGNHVSLFIFPDCEGDDASPRADKARSLPPAPFGGGQRV